MSALEASSAGVKDMADGSLRITIEFDPRFAKEAFALFGARGTPLAIAALQVGYASKSDSPPNIAPNTGDVPPNIGKPKGGALAKLAGIWCEDPTFQEWLNQTYVHGEQLRGADGAAQCLRAVCCIDSRAELDNDEFAAGNFHALIRGPFSKYLAAKGAI